mgnify:CR=1 FL=1
MGDALLHAIEQAVVGRIISPPQRMLEREGVSRPMALEHQAAQAEQRGTVGRVLARFPAAARIDQVAFRVNAVGFPLWTFGALISGPIWAHYAWGRYWGWDPKEVWALITWIVYAGYLHARVTAGWKGRRAAYLALAGFGTFIISYYVINLFVSGQHSYA